MQQYLQRAADAETQARYARSPGERQTLLEIAELWRRLAAYKTQQADLHPDPPDSATA